MHTSSFHIIVGPTNWIYDGTHNSYEREEYAFMVLLKYSIIFHNLINSTREVLKHGFGNREKWGWEWMESQYKSLCKGIEKEAYEIF